MGGEGNEKPCMVSTIDGSRQRQANSRRYEMRGKRRLHIWALAALPVVVIGGCNQDEEIVTYRVPKEEAPAPMVAADPHAGVPMPEPGMADPHAGVPMGGSAAGAPAVEGVVPTDWRPGRGSSMRLASYLVEGHDDEVADISLIVLGGQAGGVLDNINRWRGQIGLAAIDEQGLAESSTKLNTPVGEAVVVDLQATTAVADPAKDGRILAALVPADGEMWFYKMRGNVELVGDQKEGFLRWVETARKIEKKEPADMPPVGEAAQPQPKPPGSPDWRVPEGWKEMPAKSMRLATYAVGTGGEATVIKLGGDGGGELANVNRWRGQIGLKPIAEDELASAVIRVDSGAGAMSCVDCAGEPNSTLAAWLSHEGSTWYFKLTGPSALVAGERERFMGFLSSVTFPE